MSASSQVVTWDRRREDRRAEPTGRDRRRAESPVGRFEAYLDVQLEALERAASVTAGQIGAEAKKARSELARGDLDADPLDGLAQRVLRRVEGIAEEVASVRRDVTAVNLRSVPDAPSQGAELLVRQMAIAGADAVEIEEKLEKLGMDHPREAIDAVLAEPQ